MSGLRIFLAGCCALMLACSATAQQATTETLNLQFDGARAMELLEAQCAMGPRVPGTAAHKKAAQYFGEQFKALGLEPQVQRFKPTASLLGSEPVEMFNIAARLNPGQPAIVLSAHWDTRPIAEMDPDASQRNEPIMGANDGASGVAVVLELARVFTQAPPGCSLVFVLFDGEDLGSRWRSDEWCLGSKRFVPALDPDWNVNMAINVDLVGDQDLAFTREQFAAAACPEFESLCWNTARELYPGAFIGTDRRKIIDDHLAFLQAGIPAFNLIDIDYAYWHTTADTVDKCSADSLQVSGRAVEAMVRRLEAAMPWEFTADPSKVR